MDYPIDQPSKTPAKVTAPVLDPVTQEPFPYTLEDFNTTAPYDYILDIADEFLREVVRDAMEKHAKDLGKRTGFVRALDTRKKSRKSAARRELDGEPNIISYEGMELDLTSSSLWTTDEHGVRKENGIGGTEWACSHPIYPAERLRNIDTGELKVRLKWSRRRGVWDELVTEYNTLANAKDIVKLANLGVAVTSTRAKALVDYLADVMDSNYDVIPERKSVSRLGWNPEGFSPYIGEVVFDGNDAFGRMYTAISNPRGDYEAWKDEVRAVRKHSLLARIVLAASFASVLVDPMGCLPFFVHLWAADSGTGKTVAQMVAASVWGEPSVGGEYFKTFRSTSVGIEVMAGFCRSVPVFLDELQLARDSKGRIMFNVYELAAGAGKMRSNTKLGIAATPRWANCFITGGETPITGEQDGAGALNRVIEVECTPENKIIEDGHRTAAIMKANYGHAGREFIEILTEAGLMPHVKTRYEALFQTYSATDTTEKQAHSAALITLADELATKWIFRDDQAITVDELSALLRSKASVSVMRRGYEYVCDWVSQNQNRFNGKAESGEIYGRFPSEMDYENAGYVYIIRSAFSKACADAGLNAKALLSHLKASGLIKTRGRNMTMAKKVNGITTECVTLKLPSEENEEVVTEIGTFVGLDE